MPNRNDVRISLDLDYELSVILRRFNAADHPLGATLRPPQPHGECRFRSGALENIHLFFQSSPRDTCIRSAPKIPDTGCRFPDR